MNKIIINHLDRLFVTSDASVMVTELEVQHPAAKLVVLAAKAQEAEIGDGTNLVRTPCALRRGCAGLHRAACTQRPRPAAQLAASYAEHAPDHLRLTVLLVQVISLAGELLTKATDLLREGLTAIEIAEGYNRAADKVCCNNPAS